MKNLPTKADTWNTCVRLESIRKDLISQTPVCVCVTRLVCVFSLLWDAAQLEDFYEPMPYPNCLRNRILKPPRAPAPVDPGSTRHGPGRSPFGAIAAKDGSLLRTGRPEGRVEVGWRAALNDKENKVKQKRGEQVAEHRSNIHMLVQWFKSGAQEKMQGLVPSNLCNHCKNVQFFRCSEGSWVCYGVF